MINWDKINKKISVKKVILPLMMVILLLMIIIWGKILHKQICKSIFANDMEEIIAKNQSPTFSIDKIYLCSSANAIDNTAEQKLDNLGIYQYTDIAVYLNNNKEEGLSVVYTNHLKIGSKEELNQMVLNSKNIQKDKIDFKIVNTNEQNNEANYDEATFYADCSNPISLKYINEISTEYTVSKNSSAVFDGSILKKVGIKPEDINAQIKFRINIINNKDEYYSNYVNFKIPLNDIEKGTSIKSKTTVGNEYNFFTI